MAKAIALPLSEAQLIQKELGKRQEDIKRDPLVDKELCLAYQQGDHSAAIKLIYRYLDKLSFVYRFPTRTKNRGGAKCKIDITSSTTKEDKEDLFQEIIYHFTKLLLEYNPAEGDLQGLIVGKLHLRVFYYHYGDLVDIRMNEGELDDNYDMEEEMKEIFLEEKEVPDRVKHLYNVLSDLSPRQRQIIERTVCRGWTVSETAKDLRVSHKYVETTKSKSIRKLREKMEAI